MIYIIFTLIALLGVQDYFNRKERKKLIEAVLAKDLDDYKKPIEKPSKPQEPIVPEIPLESVSDEEFDMAIRKEIGKETIADKAKRFVKGKNV